MRACPREFLFAILLASGCAIAQDAGPDRAADLRSKSMETRLLAIDWLATAERKDAEALLLAQLVDKDWEVQERAAESLGKRKTKAALDKLVDFAIDGEIARVRRAAGLAAGQVDAVLASAAVWKRCKGKELVVAQEALAFVLRGHPGFAECAELQKRLLDASAPVRESAACALLEGAADRGQTLRSLLESRYLAVRCRVLDTVADAPRVEDIDALVDAFGGEGQNEVVARRIFRALAAALAIGEGDRSAAATLALKKAGTNGIQLVRRARMLPLLVSGKSPVLQATQAIDLLKPVVAAPDGAVRAAGLKALREIGGEAAVLVARGRMAQETDTRALVQLVETLAAIDGDRPETFAFFATIAKGSAPSSLRERAIVRLGRSGAKDVVEPLAALLSDSEWRIACVAAVSLGKTDDDAALQPLQKAAVADDWKLRGAAAIGFMHWSRPDAVDPLIAMLGDASPLVARTAHAALGSISRNYDSKPDAKAWRAWWGTAKGKHDFTDREAAARKQKSYGYASAPTDVYSGLDVVVLQPVGVDRDGGDHIEQLLSELKVVHRTTKPGSVLAANVHPEAIFVANCWGKLDEGDVEPLQWFVVTGGSLFGSCWALTETIARIEPGVAQLAQTTDQVMDNVRALPCELSSPLLTGVFPPQVVPIYKLEGAHLIQVLDPERCEVLIDSPDAAERWGCGNLAAWFRCGHGVLFDSVNHFDLQGLAQGGEALKDDRDRQAYAVDHMGLTLADWRASRSAGYWKNPQKSAQNVPDLSAFRLLTNFVRSKRMGEY